MPLTSAESCFYRLLVFYNVNCSSKKKKKNPHHLITSLVSQARPLMQLMLLDTSLLIINSSDWGPTCSALAVNNKMTGGQLSKMLRGKLSNRYFQGAAQTDECKDDPF